MIERLSGIDVVLLQWLMPDDGWKGALRKGQAPLFISHYGLVITDCEIRGSISDRL